MCFLFELRTTSGNPPYSMYSRTAAFMRVILCRGIFLNIMNSSRLSGYTKMSECLPVSNVASSGLMSFDDEPDTIIFAFPSSMILLTQRSHPLIFCISSRITTGVVVGFSSLRYIVKILSRILQSFSPSLGSSRFTRSTFLELEFMDIFFATCLIINDFPALLTPMMATALWGDSDDIVLSTYSFLSIPVYRSSNQKFQSDNASNMSISVDKYDTFCL